MFCTAAALVVFLLVAYGALLVAKRPLFYDYRPKPKAYTALVGCLMIVPVFLFWNRSYRYWIVFLLVPMLLEDLFGAARDVRRCLSALGVLLAIYVCGFSTVPVFPEFGGLIRPPRRAFCFRSSTSCGSMPSW